MRRCFAGDDYAVFVGPDAGSGPPVRVGRFPDLLPVLFERKDSQAWQDLIWAAKSAPTCSGCLRHLTFQE